MQEVIHQMGHIWAIWAANRLNPYERGYNKAMDKALAKERLRSQKCPYCGADRKDLAYANIENDGKEVF